MFPERSFGSGLLSKLFTQDLSQPPLSHTITPCLKLKVDAPLPHLFFPSIPTSYLRGIVLLTPHPEQIMFIGGTHSSVWPIIISVLEPAEP